MSEEISKLVLVARVSTADQLEALPAQKLSLEQYAERKNYSANEFEYHEFIESAAYGKTRNPLGDGADTKIKQKFFELLQHIKGVSQKGECIVAFDKIDRFSRDSSSDERSQLTALMRAGRIELHFPSDNLYVTKDSPAADLFRLDIGVALASYYSSSISDNVRRRFRQLLADGQWPHRAPVGYLNLRKSEKETTIIVDEERAPYIVKAFELRAIGLPYEVIAKQLADEGLRSANGRIIGKAYIEKIINETFYYGVMVHGGKSYPHKYPSLIKRNLFNQCKEVKQQRKHDMTKHDSEWFTLKKIVKCGRCGRAVSSYWGRKNVYLRCSGTGLKSCGNPNSAEALLLDDMTADVTFAKIPTNFIGSVITELKQRHEDNQTYYANNVDQLRREHGGIQGKMETLYNDRLDGRISAERYDELVASMEARQQELDDQLSKLANNNKSFIVTESYLLDLCQKAANLFACSNYELRQQLLSFMFSNIELSDKKLSYTLNDPFREVVKLNKLASKGSKSSFWQEWAEGFQTLDDLQSVNLTPEDEVRIKQLFSDEADEEAVC